MPAISKIRVDNVDYDIKSKDVYSSSEAVIGLWIDGKPLYRRVYETATALDASEITIAQIINAEPKRIEGYFFKDTMLQPYGDMSVGNVQTYKASRVFADMASVANTATIKVQQEQYYITNNYKARVIVEYTKSTDPSEYASL